jgi:hypothetical protein
MDNKHIFKAAADAAAFLWGDEQINDMVEDEINRSRMVLSPENQLQEYDATPDFIEFCKTEKFS